MGVIASLALVLTLTAAAVWTTLATPTPAITAAPTAIATPADVPVAPTEPIILGGIQVYWKDNSDNEAGFRITVAVSDGSSGGISRTYEAPANATNIMLPSDVPRACVDGNALSLSIRAFNSRGESEQARYAIVVECSPAPSVQSPEVQLPATGDGGSGSGEAVERIAIVGAVLFLAGAATSAVTRILRQS